jgi:peroxiredoxin
MLPLGTLAPNFELPDSEGRKVKLDDFQGAPALLVAFISNHCPYVQHIRAGFASLVRDFQARGVAVVAIGSNDATEYPDDSPEAIREEVARVGYTMPYLHDESQEVAKAYRAACTPDFFLFDSERKLVYRGQMDGARKFNDVPVDGVDLRSALDAVLEGRPVASEQKPSLGCNIKWKAGNEPEYFLSG